MRLLVTGGAGFLGSHVVDMLIDRGHRVTVLDNLSTGVRGNVHTGAQFEEMDICSSDLAPLLMDIRPDVVIHLAAQTSVPISLERPDYDLATNLTGTVNLVQAMVNAKSQKIIAVSSASVYGTPTSLPLREDSPTRPLSPYGLSKLTGEGYIRMLCDHHGMQFTILRPANIYGPRQRGEGDGAVIPAFLNRFLHGTNPIIEGNGSQTRDFIYVTDVAEAVCQALTRGRGLTLNVSTGHAISILNLWSSIAELVGWSGTPQFGPARPGDILHSVMENEAATRALDWMPKVDLNIGLAKTVEWVTTGEADSRHNMA